MRWMLTVMGLIIVAHSAWAVDSRPEMCEPTAQFMLGLWEIMFDVEDPEKRRNYAKQAIRELLMQAEYVYGRKCPPCAEIERRAFTYYEYLESIRYVLNTYTPPWERQPTDLYQAHQRTMRDLELFQRVRIFCDPVKK